VVIAVDSAIVDLAGLVDLVGLVDLAEDGFLGAAAGCQAGSRP
jgi:hypothetical protein